MMNRSAVPPLAGFEHTYERQPFHPWFLKSLERFSAVRFMDWGSTNNPGPSEWQDRTQTTSDTQARPGGVAIGELLAGLQCQGSVDCCACF